jgi:uncharacterized iron-regulated protein
MAQGFWIEPATAARLPHAAAMARLGGARVALLGERHDRAEDHRWQAQVLAGLAALRSEVVVGFEMFPRPVQPALDAWTAGGLTPTGFLEATRWREVWGFDPGLYQPLFDLCRDLRLPMVALNVDRPLVSAIGRDGWGAVPEAERGWLTPARPASAAYRRYLFEITGGVREGRAAQGPEDPAFDRFTRAQQAWDRAFACALAEALARRPEALAVGLIGRGHLEHGYGVPDQLDDLGLGPAVTALRGAADGAGRIADLVYAPPTA